MKERFSGFLIVANRGLGYQGHILIESTGCSPTISGLVGALRQSQELGWGFSVPAMWFCGAQPLSS